MSLLYTSIPKHVKNAIFFQKKYKEEMGKYQLAIRSSKNKAALTDEKVRYKR